MGSTDQTDTFIAVAPDCPANQAEIRQTPRAWPGCNMRCCTIILIG